MTRHYLPALVLGGWAGLWALGVTGPAVVAVFLFVTVGTLAESTRTKLRRRDGSRRP